MRSTEIIMPKLPDRFFAEHVIVIGGQADGPLIFLKWVNGKLVIVKPPPPPDPWFKDFSRVLNVLGAASQMKLEVSQQIAQALQPMLEQHLSGVLSEKH
jgi:hypothetical protein